MSVTTVKRYGLAAQVMERMKALIAEGTYRVGQRLPAEGELCEIFGVGRSTLREAMRVLANRGLVDVRHGEGTFVLSAASGESLEERLGKAALSDIYEARLLLELPLAELAARRRTARDVAAMRAALKRRSVAIEAGDVRGYVESDFSFHRAVAKAAKNRALADVYDVFVSAVLPQFVPAITLEYVRSENDALHADLCEAIAAGNQGETRRLVQSHLRRSLTGIRR